MYSSGKICCFAVLILSISFSCSHTKSKKSKKKVSEEMIRIEGKSDTVIINNGTHVFFVEIMPGNIPVDENGQELPGSGSRKYYTIYIETDHKDVVWEKALNNENGFAIRPTLITEAQLEVGKDAINEKPIILKKTAGKFLWKLELDAAEKNEKYTIQPIGTGFIVSGLENGKPFKKKTPAPVQLYTPPSV